MKIDFYTLAEGLELAYPIYPAKNLKMDWIKQAQKTFQDSRKDLGQVRHSSSHMCSGIRQLVQNAFVLTTWHDINIITNGDGHTFKWFTPSTNNETVFYPHKKENIKAVEYFAPSTYGDFAPLPKDTLKTIIKIPTPWRVHMPTGWGLMYLPLHYYDEQRFTSSVGVLDPSISNELNGILFWHELNSDVLIKAGTPLCYLVPVKLNENLNHVVRVANQKDFLWEKIRKTIFYSVWVNGAKKIKETHIKFWGEK